jgi:pimeloyl-ACP methyl ester carboxylesterase
MWRVAKLTPLVVMLFGVAYVNVGELVDSWRFPQVGKSIDVGGRTLNLFCSGSGSPTVVFESGFGQPGYSWRLVQPRVAATNRACWYDRAGNGWSDEAGGKRYSDSVAVDLHRLLRAARVPPPYVLVGHSLGGFHLRVFHAMYPREVVGLVFVDPSNEDIGKIPAMPRGGGPNAPPIIVHIVDAIVRQSGLWRWFMRDQGPKPDSLSPHDWAVISSLRRQRKMLRAESREAPERGSAAIARRADALDSVPLVVLTRGKPFPMPDTAAGSYLLRAWIDLSADLAHRSSRGTHIVVPGAGHFIQYSAPQVVVDAIRQVIAAGLSPPNH